jgi:hypothetical protein
MKVLEFKYFDKNDITDGLYCAHLDNKLSHTIPWSRPYEYKFVMDELLKDKNKDIFIHNTCWGFTGVHIIFKNELEKCFSNVVNSDIKPSEFKNTIVYDITKDEPTFHNKFDYVLNISALEEIQNADHVELLKNHYNQLKIGGKLIITFDVHEVRGLQLAKVENFLGQKIKNVKEKLNGGNSKFKNEKYTHLNCGKLIIERDI